MVSPTCAAHAVGFHLEPDCSTQLGYTVIVSWYHSDVLRCCVIVSCLFRSVQVLGGSVDGTVRQFDIRMGMMFTDTINEPVTGIAVSHDGNCILASCLDNSMRLLDKASGELLATYTGTC